MSWQNAKQLLVKEQVGMFKAASNYDVFDLHSGEQVLACREPNLGFFTRMLRFTDYTAMTPFDVQVTDAAGNLVVQVTRGISVWRSKVQVFDGYGQSLGSFRQKMLSIGGAFQVLNNDGQEVCKLQGKWTGWEFSFTAGGVELARVTKKWSGVGKEMFTTADNYVLDIDESIAPESDAHKLIIAAVMCIDKVLKE